MMNHSFACAWSGFARLKTCFLSLLLLGLLSVSADEPASGDGPVAPEFSGQTAEQTVKKDGGDGPLAPDFAGKSDESQPEPAALRVGINASGPPIIFLQDDKIVGIEADLAQALGESLGREVEFVQMPFNRLLPALLADQLDIIMSGMSVTQMRALRVDFSQPYMEVGLMPLVRSDDLAKYEDPLDLLDTKGKVGVEAGTTSDVFVQENFIYATREPYDSIYDAVADLANGKIDMIVDDSPIIWWLAAENESQGLAPVVVSMTEEHLAWAVRKDDPELLKQANDFLRQYRSSGELLALIKKWLSEATDF